jgi:prolipoprotein diacylglyceryltransferase
MPVAASRPGWIVLATIITYAAVRFVLEYLRADGVLALGKLTITQLQYFVLAVVATAVLWAMRADSSLLRATMR